jgi:hypothetical protein
VPRPTSSRGRPEAASGRRRRSGRRAPADDTARRATGEPEFLRPTGCTLDAAGDPVSIPHDIEKRRVTTGTDPEPDPQVNGLIPLPPQVTGSARPNLSRWRHGFKSRWDYERKSARSGHRCWIDRLVEPRLKRRTSREYPESDRAWPVQAAPSGVRVDKPAHC